MNWKKNNVFVLVLPLKLCFWTLLILLPSKWIFCGEEKLEGTLDFPLAPAQREHVQKWLGNRKFVLLPLKSKPLIIFCAPPTRKNVNTSGLIFQRQITRVVHKDFFILCSFLRTKLWRPPNLYFKSYRERFFHLAQKDLIIAVKNFRIFSQIIRVLYTQPFTLNVSIFIQSLSIYPLVSYLSYIFPWIVSHPTRGKCWYLVLCILYFVTSRIQRVVLRFF